VFCYVFVQFCLQSRPWNDLCSVYCVGRDVKPYFLTHSL